MNKMAQGIVNTAGSTLIKAQAYADDVAADAESAAKAENYYPEYHADEVDAATNFYIDCANVDNTGTALFKAKARGVKKWCDLKSGAAFTIADANIKSDGIVSTDGALTATLTSYAGFNTSSSFTILFCAKIAQQDSNDDETVLFQLGNTRVLQIQQKGVDGIRLVTYDEDAESHVYPTKLTEGDYTTGHYIVPLLAEGSSSDYGTYHHFAVVFDTDSQTVTWYEDGYEYTSDTMENTYVKVDGGYNAKILEKTGDGLRYFKIIRTAMTADEVKTYMDTHPHTNYTSQPKIQYDNILLELERKSPAYSTCSTAASTAKKTAGYDGFMLVKGARAAVKFTYANTATAPTLNINGTGAKPIYLGGIAASSGNAWSAGETVDFVYDGTCWQGIRPLSDENSAAEALSTAAAAKTAADAAQKDIEAHTANDNVASDTSGTASPAHGGTFDVVDSIERDSAGHVLKVNTTEVTLPTDNNTDTMVKQTNTETNSSYRLLMSATASDSTLTEAARKSTNFKANPSTGVLTAPTFSGALSGNASTATKLATARTLQTNLESTSAVSFDGSAAVTPGVTGVLPTANGGTGNTSGQAASVANSLTLTLNGSSTNSSYNGAAARSKSWYAPTAAGSAGQILTSNGSGAPSWATPRNFATYVVAASDSVNAAGADYVCDGTADNVQIQSAINALADTGGKIILLEGTYNISSVITLSQGKAASVIIEGMSHSAFLGEDKGTIINIESGLEECFYSNGGFCHITFRNLTFTGETSHGIIRLATYSIATFDSCAANLTVTGTEATAIVEGSSQNLLYSATYNASGASIVYLIGANYFRLTYSNDTEICGAAFRSCVVFGGGCYMYITVNGSHQNSIFYDCKGDFGNSVVYGADIICSTQSLNIHDCYLSCKCPTSHILYTYGSFCNNRISIGSGTRNTSGVVRMSAAQINGNKISCADVAYAMSVYTRTFNGNVLYNSSSYLPVLTNGYMSVTGNVWRYAPKISAATSVESGNVEDNDLSIALLN